MHEERLPLVIFLFIIPGPTAITTCFFEITVYSFGENTEVVDILGYVGNRSFAKAGTVSM